MCEHCHDEEEMTKEKARKVFIVTKVHAPHLDKDMRPEFQLLNMKCPIGRDGMCCRCDKFRGFISEDGTIFARASFEGFCDTKDKEALRIEGQGW